MRGHFIQEGHSFPIRAKAGSKERDIDVILPPGLVASHRVEKKSLPANIPTTWRDASGKDLAVTWIGNFGLKQAGKTTFVRGEVGESYEIHIDKEEGKTLVYFDGSHVQAFDPSDLGEPADKPGKVAVRLKLGDPPIGFK